MSTKIALIVLFVASMILISYTRVGKKKRVVFFGDSITEQGAKPEGYITKMDSIIKQENIDTQYELLGAGISGNKVYDLFLRMDEDVINKSPDITVLYIGVNDVWHKSSKGTGTDEDKFEKFYRAIIRKLQYVNSKIILCTPAVIGERKDFTNSQDGDLNRYSNVIRKLANEFSLPLVDLRKLFIDYDAVNNLENKDRGILTTDGVHLNPTGNLFVANAIWEAIKMVN
jgi:lysophospholipase L1-like esterase